MSVVIREFQNEDAPAVNVLALAAFEQYREHYSDWPRFSDSLAKTAVLAENSEFVVAEFDGNVVGAVAYIGPSRPKNAFFESEWAIMRMLVVSPAARGQGIGRLLAEDCLSRGRRDNAKIFALHTTTIMRVALAMYERMGFAFLREAPTILGVPYGIYIKRLDAQQTVPAYRCEDAARG